MFTKELHVLLAKEDRGRSFWAAQEGEPGERPCDTFDRLEGDRLPAVPKRSVVNFPTSGYSGKKPSSSSPDDECRRPYSS